MQERIEADKWWLFCADYESQGNRSIIYACHVPIADKNAMADKAQSIDLSNDCKLNFNYKIITKEDLNTIKENLYKNIIDFSGFEFGSLEKLSVSEHHSYIQRSFGYSSVTVEAFYALDSLKISSNEKFIEHLGIILTKLEEELNLPFKSTYASRLGAIEIHEANTGDNLPFIVDFIRNEPPSITNTPVPDIQISRKPPFSNQEQNLHLIFLFRGNEVFHKLIKLEKDIERSEIIDIKEDFDEIRLWLFNKNGEILYHESGFYIMEVGLNSGMLSQKISLEDKLTHRAKSKNHELGEKAKNVTRVTTQRSTVNLNTAKNIRAHSFFMEDITKQLFPKSINDQWFSNSLENEIEVIEHFKALIDRGDADKAIIVDPFFGAESFERLVLRLEQTQLELFIVTSLSNIDADTGHIIPNNKDPIYALKTAISKISKALCAKVNVINLSWGEKDQAFHDRYLIIYPHNSPPKTYLLSNSINKMAGNWPFCMSLLEPQVAIKVRKYAEGLCEGKDITRPGDPTITFRWPEIADAQK